MSPRILEHSLIRILSLSAKPVGMAFLVDKRIALTCAHVVARACDWTEVLSGQPTELISLNFPLLAPNQIIQARIVTWLPPAGYGDDIAVLELQTDPPRNQHPSSKPNNCKTFITGSNPVDASKNQPKMGWFCV